MKVIINDRTYEMSREAYEGILTTVKKFVPKGVYAVEKDDFAEAKKDICNTDEELKKLVADYKKKGFKVHYNKPKA